MTRLILLRGVLGKGFSIEETSGDDIRWVPHWLQTWEPVLLISQGKYEASLGQPRGSGPILTKEVGLGRVLGPVAASMRGNKRMR